MRFLFYNIAYATGGPSNQRHSLLTMHRYLRSPHRHFESLRQFISESEADITGAVEIDNGSVRAGRRSHVQDIATDLRHNAIYSSKYHDKSIGRVLPILRHQGNAVFCRDQVEHSQAHFLTFGFKRLVLETHVSGVRVFLVHLALRRDTRVKQLQDLARIVGDCRDKPVLVAGDFNVYRGREELDGFQSITGLRSANSDRQPTYPTWAPTRELDFIMYSAAIKPVKFMVRHDIRLSDHLPLILDFELN